MHHAASSLLASRRPTCSDDLTVAGRTSRRYAARWQTPGRCTTIPGPAPDVVGKGTMKAGRNPRARPFAAAPGRALRRAGVVARKTARMLTHFKRYRALAQPRVNVDWRALRQHLHSADVQIERFFDPPGLFRILRGRFERRRLRLLRAKGGDEERGACDQDADELTRALRRRAGPIARGVPLTGIPVFALQIDGNSRQSGSELSTWQHQD